jgi:hypothetical protein
VHKDAEKHTLTVSIYSPFGAAFRADGRDIVDRLKDPLTCSLYDRAVLSLYSVRLMEEGQLINKEVELQTEVQKGKASFDAQTMSGWARD